jgi:hypothetical protein
MGPAMVLTTGILFLLHSMNIADLRPHLAGLDSLVVGIVKLLQSSASSAGHIGNLCRLPPAPTVQSPPQPSPPSNLLPATAGAASVVRGGAAMASPVQNPPLQPPVRTAQTPPRRYRRSFAGPFVLIVLGIIFLLGNLHLLCLDAGCC